MKSPACRCFVISPTPLTVIQAGDSCSLASKAMRKFTKSIYSHSRLLSTQTFTFKLQHHVKRIIASTDHSAGSFRKCRILDLRDRFVPYREAWDLQHTLVDELKRDSEAPDTLILLEHQPVYTLGTASKLENVLFPAPHVFKPGDRISNKSTPVLKEGEDVDIVRTERGGEVTYHGPGQIVVYPILNLRRHKMDLHWYLRSLEDVVISMLKEEYALNAERKDGLTGVWVDDQKVCAMGLKVSKWITMHGFALNVNMNLNPFKRIVPCGISNYGVSSLHLLASDAHSQNRAREGIIRTFDKTFGPYEFSIQYERSDLPTSPAIEADAIS